MVPSFAVEVDEARNLVKIVMTGFFEPADVARFAQGLAPEFKKLGRGIGTHVTLVDIRGMAIQSQEAVEAFRGVLSNPVIKSRKLAIIVARSLARMQIQRAASHREVGYFDTEEAAEAWLFGNGDAGR